MDYDYPTHDTLVGGQGCPCNLKGLENERGYRLKPKHFKSLSRPIEGLSDVPVSRK